EILAVDKPAGVVSVAQAGRGGLPGLLRGVYGGRLFPVHRLDKEVSGVIVFAKTAAVHRHLNREFEKRNVRKTYVAVCHGEIARNRGVITAPIREFGSGRMGVDRERGRPASTEFRVLEKRKGFTEVQAHPLTGRRHQIRVHLYSIGHPIVGDTKYGDREVQKAFPRLMLHALSIEMTLPSGARVTIDSPLPDCNWGRPTASDT
ncbi:MAG TPA: RNA pseudouridine synthase, partial [Desulfobaccales bacterium]|nr:RNA pseudouridine synthase [Desulfobaccales bacterium]